MASCNLKIRFLLLLVISLFMTATNGEAFKEGVVPEFNLENDLSTLYIYREWSFVGGGIDFEVYVNDEFLGESDNGSVLWTKVKPGSHDLWVTYASGQAPKLKELDMEKGKNYYIGLDVSVGSVSLFEKDELSSKNNILDILKK